MKDFDFKIPEVAKGNIVPHSVLMKEYNDLKEKHEKKAQRRHDYIVALIGSISGGIMGLIASVIFWLITK